MMGVRITLEMLRKLDHILVDDYESTVFPKTPGSEVITPLSVSPFIRLCLSPGPDSTLPSLI